MRTGTPSLGGTPLPETRRVPFVVPTQAGGEARAAADALERGAYASGGPFTRALEAELAERCGVRRAFLTATATEALTVAAMVLDIGPGDEAIVPSFTFVSTAVAFASRGATVVFADIDPTTLCLDPRSVAQLTGPRTRAVVPVHYGGHPADLDSLREVVSGTEIAIVEDNAHGLGGAWGDQPLGSGGELSVLSFDYAKNIQSGEGGALLTSHPRWAERAEVILSKGTNRHEFMAGKVDTYDWVDLGGHFRPPDYVAAILSEQLKSADDIQRRRDVLWNRYAWELAAWADTCGVRLPPTEVRGRSTHHIYWAVLPSTGDRDDFIRWMRDAGIETPFHYTSLARSPAAARFARDEGTLVSDRVAVHLVRLPLHHALTDDDQHYVISRATSWRPREQIERDSRAGTGATP